MVAQMTIYSALIASTMVFASLLYSHFTSPLPEDLDFAPVNVDLAAPEAVVQRLAGLLRFRTVSSTDAENHAVFPKEFESQLQYLRSSFPSVFTQLEVQEVNNFSLLLKWQGSDPSLKPGMCISHLDVVAVGEDGEWTHPPFSGAVAEGFVWGRGALDVKVTAIALLEAVTVLLKKGQAPQRTLYLAFGHDEEVMGSYGAGAIAQQLQDAKVELEFISDEGGSVLVDGVRGLTTRAIALVGTAEKSLKSYSLEVRGKGGHSMTPPVDGSSVVSRLARIVLKLEKSLPRPRIEAPTSDFLQSLGSVTKAGVVSALLQKSSVWPLSRLAALLISRTDGDLSACVRSTAVVTDIELTPKGKNVISSVAKATVNFRLLPGERPTYAADLLANAAKGEFRGGDVKIVEERDDPFVPLSSTANIGFKAIRRAAIETLRLPQGLLVSPYLMLGRTDSSQYTKRGLTREVFRFMPFPMNRTSGDVHRVHGVDERVSVEGYLDGIRFYVRFLQHSLW